MKKLYYSILVCIALFSCEHTKDIPPPPPDLDKDVVLYVAADGLPSWIVIFNANTMDVIDTIRTESEVNSLGFSNDFTKLYAVWKFFFSEFDARFDLHAVDVKSKNVTTRQDVTYQYLVGDYGGQRLIGFRKENGITVYDKNSLMTVLDDTTLSYIHMAVPSKVSPRLYMAEFGYTLNIVVYNTDSLRTERTLFIEEIQGRAFESMAVSPDDKYLYVSTYNPLGGYGKFHVIDLAEGSQIDEEICGGMAQMVVSSDGRYVYLSDPGGYINIDIIPTGKILRYNTQTRRMETLVNGCDGLGLSCNYTLRTDQIQIAEDDRTLFISAWPTLLNEEGEHIPILKIDGATGRLLGAYPLPKKPDGKPIGGVYRLKLAKYPANGLGRK